MRADLKWMFRTFTWEEILKSQFSVFSYYLTHLPEDLKKKKKILILRHLLLAIAQLIVYAFLSYSRPCIKSWHSRFVCKWFSEQHLSTSEPWQLQCMMAFWMYVLHLGALVILTLLQMICILNKHCIPNQVICVPVPLGLGRRDEHHLHKHSWFKWIINSLKCFAVKIATLRDICFLLATSCSLQKRLSFSGFQLQKFSWQICSPTLGNNKRLERQILFLPL